METMFFDSANGINETADPYLILKDSTAVLADETEFGESIMVINLDGQEDMALLVANNSSKVGQDKTTLACHGGGKAKEKDSKAEQEKREKAEIRKKLDVIEFQKRAEADRHKRPLDAEEEREIQDARSALESGDTEQALHLIGQQEQSQQQSRKTPGQDLIEKGKWRGVQTRLVVNQLQMMEEADKKHELYVERSKDRIERKEHLIGWRKQEKRRIKKEKASIEKIHHEKKQEMAQDVRDRRRSGNSQVCQTRNSSYE